MSRCGRVEQLDALVTGEVSGARADELHRHASSCSVCRHELRWLQSERALFAQRAARDEVDDLWQQLKARTGHTPRKAAVARVLMGVAATVLLVLSAGTRLGSAQRFSYDLSAEAPMSVELMSVDPTFGACFSPGFGLACGPALPASFSLDR